jgi:hypothetical protein
MMFLGVRFVEGRRVAGESRPRQAVMGQHRHHHHPGTADGSFLEGVTNGCRAVRRPVHANQDRAAAVVSVERDHRDPGIGCAPRRARPPSREAPPEPGHGRANRPRSGSLPGSHRPKRIADRILSALR